MMSWNTNGVSTGYAYDSISGLSTVVDARLGGSGTTSYARDTANNLTTANYPNGLQSILTYDQLNRVAGLASQVSGYLYQRSSTDLPLIFEEDLGTRFV